MKFDLQPILKSSLIFLRPLQEIDFESLYSVASDDLIWEQHPQKNRHPKNIFQNYFQSAIQSKGALLIQDVKSNEVIGSSRYYELDSNGEYVFIGYTFLSRKYWGGVFNHELKKLMINHAFKHVSEVRFHVGEKNLRSQKAMEKIGAELLEKIFDPIKYPDLDVRFIYSVKNKKASR